MIQELLKDIGFNEKEVLVYMEALRLGRTTPARIAKNTGINRTTVYSVVNNLVEKGVISEDLAGKYDYILALPPECLTTILDRDKKILMNKEKKIVDAIEELEKLPTGVQYSVPKIRFVEELDIEEFMYKQISVWNSSILSGDHFWRGFQDHTFVENYEKWIKDYWKHKTTQNITLNLLTNQSEIETKMTEINEPRRKIRFWGNDLNFTSTLWVCGDYVIIVFTNEHPHYLIEIFNPELAKNMGKLFEGIWKQLNIRIN